MQSLDFYPRSPCGERRYTAAAGHHSRAISIHALLAESDGGRSRQRRDLLRFLSTLSLRRATTLTGGLQILLAYFYPRSPCGERPAMGNPTFEIAYFYPRSPCGERLFRVAVPEHVIVISIHALLAESDYPIYTLLAAPCAISIHALLAESDIIPICMSVTASISIHALLAESDPAVRRNKTAFSVFLSTLSLRRATPDEIGRAPRRERV